MPNLRGGKAYKKSKKSSGNDDDENVLFLRKEKDQMVGRLTKLLGNLNTSVFCEDNKTRLCKIAVGIKKSIRFAVGDIVGIAIDADNGAVYFSVNGTYLNSGVPTSGASRTGSFHNWTPDATRVCFPALCAYTTSIYADANFGQQPFIYTPPSGFVALNTYNL
jgi:initiation factor 1A